MLGAYRDLTVIGETPAIGEIKIGAKVVNHGRYVTFQMAEVAIPRAVFAELLQRIAALRLRSAPAPT